MNLWSLLQSAVGIPTPQNPDIEVTAKKKPPIPVQPPAEEIAAPAAEPAKRRMLSDQQLMNRQGVGNLPEHKGMFGTKGTLRDILGLVGDAFLVQSGNKAMYAPQRQKEKTSDAMAEMVNSPVNAIQALLGAGAHEEAYELYKQFQAQGNKDAELEIDRGKASATAGKNSQDAYKEGTRLFGQYSGAIARNPKLAAQLLPVLGQIKEQYGLGDEFAIPGADDAEAFEGFQYGGTPVQTQITEGGRNARFTEGERGKDRRVAAQQAGADRRDNPPATPQPTDAAIAARLSAKAEKLGGYDKLPKVDQETLTRMGRGPNRGKTQQQLRMEARDARKNSAPAAKPTGKYVIRGGKLVPAER